TPSVAPRAAAAAAVSATTSAWSPPYSAWNPSPTTAPCRSTTAPTSGLGATRPQPPSASSRARRIASASEGEAEAQPSEDMAPLGIEAGEVGREVLVLASLIAQLTYELGGREVKSSIEEQDFPGVVEVERNPLGVGERARGIEERHFGLRAVVVPPHAPRELEEDHPQ